MSEAIYFWKIDVTADERLRLAHGFWIGNSHCSLIRAPNTDSQKTNQLLFLTWLAVPYNWVTASFSQVPCSQSVQTKQVAAEEQALPVHKTG